MEGRWQDAPESLLRALKKFERILESINEYMQNEADNKWRTRFARRTSIEEALAHFNLELDDAARSFQIATLINIHYSVGDRPRTQRKPMLALDGPNDTSTQATNDNTPAPPYETTTAADDIPITDAVEFVQSPVSRQNSDGASFEMINPIPTLRTRSEDFIVVGRGSSDSASLSTSSTKSSVETLDSLTSQSTAATSPTVSTPISVSIL
ncbi:hypothetical protein CERSUDRAFT_85801, partial [Gelatoporia subvermispora B]